jgi:hypothetical protein
MYERKGATHHCWIEAARRAYYRIRNRCAHFLVPYGLYGTFIK